MCLLVDFVEPRGRPPPDARLPVWVLGKDMLLARATQIDGLPATRMRALVPVVVQACEQVSRRLGYLPAGSRIDRR